MRNSAIRGLHFRASSAHHISTLREEASSARRWSVVDMAAPSLWVNEGEGAESASHSLCARLSGEAVVGYSGGQTASKPLIGLEG